MLKKIKDFEYYAPTALSEGISLLEKYGKDAKILAGGTDLLVGMKESGLSPKCLISIKNISDLNHIAYDEKMGLRIGATTRIRDIETSKPIRENYAHLAQGAKAIGSIQIRYRATIGGNICNASPCADTVPPLMVSDAQLKLIGPEGERLIAVNEFFTGPGFTVLSSFLPGYLLQEIIIPPPAPNTRSIFMDISRRKALDLSLVSVAAKAELSDPKGKLTNVRIALGSVAPTVMRANQAEFVLEGKRFDQTLLEKAAKTAAEESSPIDDVRASAWYRKEMVALMVKRSFNHIVQNF
jgi:carbon-monoxide dehydrogenase medium subunit